MLTVSKKSLHVLEDRERIPEQLIKVVEVENMTSVLVSCDCCDKLPQKLVVDSNRNFFVYSSGGQKTETKCQEGSVALPPGDLWENLSLPLPASGGCPSFPGLVAASLPSLPVLPKPSRLGRSV